MHQNVKPTLGKNEEPKYPFRVFSVDSAGPMGGALCGPTENGNFHILVGVDHFSKFCILKAVPKITAEAMCNFLCESVIAYFGLFEVLITDSHQSFRSNLISQMCEKLKIKHHFSSSYNPQSNGLCENRVKVTKSVLKAYCQDHPNSWDTYLPFVQNVLNSTISSTTKYSPHHVIFGRQPLSFLDIQLSLPSIDYFDNYEDYMVNLVRNLFTIYRICDEQIGKQRKSQRLQYNKNAVVLPVFREGDLVYVQDKAQNPREIKGLKLKFRGPYIILKVLKDSLFLVQELSGTSVRRTVNGRLIKPVKDSETFLRLNPIFQEKIDMINKSNIANSKVKSKDEEKSSNGYSLRQRPGEKLLVVQNCLEQPVITNKSISEESRIVELELENRGHRRIDSTSSVYQLPVETPVVTSEIMEDSSVSSEQHEVQMEPSLVSVEVDKGEIEVKAGSSGESSSLRRSNRKTRNKPPGYYREY